MIWSNPLLVVNPTLGFHYLTSLAWSASTIRQYYLISYRLRHEALDFAEYTLHLLSRPWEGTAIVWTVFSFLGSNIFSFLTASLYIFIFCWFDSSFKVESKSVGKVPKGTYLWSSLQSLPDSAEMGRNSVSEERISKSFRWDVFWSKWNGQAVFDSLLFDFWYHHPLIINGCPPKRYLSFFPKIILPCCFLSIDFPLFYFLLFGKTNHFIVCFRLRLPNTMPKRPAD